MGVRSSMWNASKQPDRSAARDRGGPDVPPRSDHAVRELIDLDFGPRRRSWLAWAAPLAVMAALAWFLSAWKSDRPRFSPHASVSFEVDRIDWENVRSAFASAPRQPRPLPDDDQRRITRLLLRAMSHAAPASLPDTVDFDRLVGQIEATGYVRSLTDVEREELLDAITPRIFIDVSPKRFDLVAVRAVGPNEYTAFVRVWAPARCHLMKWWLSNVNGAWKWYDWLDLGSRRQLSEELAVIWAYRDDPMWHAALLGGSWQRSGGPPLVVVQDNWNQGRRWSAVEKLRVAESRAVHRFVADAYHVELVRHWVRMQRWGDATRLLKGIQRPDQIPDVDLLWAACDVGQGRFDNAVKHLQAYEARLGPSPGSCRLRVERARALQDQPAVLDACRQWLNLEPGGIEPLMEFARAATAEDVPELIAAFKNAPAPRRAFRQVVLESLRHPVDRWWSRLAAVSDAIDAEGSLGHVLAAVQAEHRGDLEAAADEMALAVQVKKDPLRGVWNRRLIDLLIRTNQWERLLTDPIGPAFALWTLTETIDTEAALHPPGRLLKLCESYRSQHPDSMWAALLVADAAAIEGRWERAKEEFSRAFKYPAAVRNSRARSRWVEVCWRLDGPIAALRQAKNRTQALHQIGSQLVADADWKQLEQLLQEFRAYLTEYPSLGNCWHDYFTTRLWIARGDLAQAGQMLERVIRQSGAVTSGGWVLNEAVPLLIQRTLDDGSWRTPLADPRIGERFWHRWIEELNRRRRDNPTATELFQEFLGTYEEMHGREPEVLYWQVRLAWETRRYGEVLRLLTPWPESDMLSLSATREHQCRSWLIESLARQGHWETVEEVARQAADEGNASWAARLAASRFDWNTIGRLLVAAAPSQRDRLVATPEIASAWYALLWAHANMRSFP